MLAIPRKAFNARFSTGMNNFIIMNENKMSRHNDITCHDMTFTWLQLNFPFTLAPFFLILQSLPSYQ